ncbi:MAG: MMPL family transporter, partial [Planctomycetota bacterium]
MPRAAACLWAVLLVLAGVGWTRLTFSTEIQDTLGRHDPAVQALVELDRDFGLTSDLRVMASTGDPARPLPDGAVESTRQALRDATPLAAMGVTPRPEPEALAKRWLIDHAPRGRAWLDDAALAELRQRIEPDAMAARFARHRLRLATPQPAEVTRRLLQDPLALRELIPQDVTRRLGRGGQPSPQTDLEVDPDPDALAGRFNDAGDAWQCRLAVPVPASDAAQAAALHAEVNRVLDALRAEHPGVTFDAAGAHLIAAEAAARVKRDVQGTVIFAGLGLVLLFGIAWRRPAPIVALLGSTGVSLFTAFGLYGLSGWPLSPLAALSGGMLAGLGVDYGIHVLSDFARQTDMNATQAQRARRAARNLARPIVTACATTACGFLALSATEPAGLVQLALLGSLGLVCACLAALTLLPALVGIAGASPRTTPGLGVGPVTWAAGRPKAMIASGVVLALSLVLAIAAPSAGHRAAPLYDLQPQPNPVLAAQQRFDAAFGQPPGAVFVLVDASHPQDLHHRLHALQSLDTPFDAWSA